MTREIDEKLKPYATPAQWSYYTAYCSHGTQQAAAVFCGVSQSVISDGIKRIKEKAVLAGHVPEGWKVSKVSTTTDADGATKSQSVQVKPDGMDPARAQHVADPKKITKTSTLFDSEGKVAQQWVMEKPELVEREHLWKMFAEELARKVERAEPILRVDSAIAHSNLLACYPIGDHHLGMLAWNKETQGGSWDMDIAENLLRDAASFLIDTQVPAETALVAFLGDFMHYDGFEPVTPTSRNLLDADGRYPKMVRAAIRSMRHLIDAALRRHKEVRVIIEIGNHDLSSSIFLQECLHNIYENEPRCSIDTSPSHYHYFEFGRNLIGTHHGHGSKMEKLPLVMAADRPEAWERTGHRYWWTGHIHNRTAQDFAGCSVESFRILAPVDAWAAQKGYRPIRQMQSITLHKEHGEVGRTTVNPAMFRE